MSEYDTDPAWCVSENEKLYKRIDELEEALRLRDSTMAEESKQFEALQAELQAMQARLDNRPVQPIMEWVGLTNDEIIKVARKSQEGLSPHDDTYTFARAVEAALKEKNHGE
jgi:hypothetical protein